jgi:exodeoxyribonuclease VII large subunit
MAQFELFPEEDEPPVDEPAAPQILSVGELTELVKGELEDRFPDVWVSGEISNFSRPHSGHCYFTLKDDEAQIRAVIWRTTATRVPFELHDGLEVICQGGLEIYAPRGTYQIVVRQIQPQGLGALELALRQLRAKLEIEGLFAADRKRPLPRFPRRIAVVTSPTGAAIRDFLEVLRRRWCGADVWILPARVQGVGAAAEIVAAIHRANRLADRIDCLVLARGGGSLEDLWSFNEEAVVRAIVASRIPVVSAIGHEIDVTLSDLAADVRALTPSEAAELIVPARDEMLGILRQHRRRLLVALERRATLARRRLEAIADRREFRKPLERVHNAARRLDELEVCLDRAIRQKLLQSRRRTEHVTAQLESLSPLGVLGRGYSLTQRINDASLVRDAATLAIGETIRTRFAKGSAVSRIEEIEAEWSRLRPTSARSATVSRYERDTE